MKYKLYHRNKKLQFQEYLNNEVGAFRRCDMFGHYAIIDEEEALSIKLKYPDAHMFPILESTSKNEI